MISTNLGNPLSKRLFGLIQDMRSLLMYEIEQTTMGSIRLTKPAEEKYEKPAKSEGKFDRIVVNCESQVDK